jgi:hypothetical protein
MNDTTISGVCPWEDRRVVEWGQQKTEGSKLNLSCFITLK